MRWRSCAGSRRYASVSPLASPPSLETLSVRSSLCYQWSQHATSSTASTATAVVLTLSGTFSGGSTSTPSRSHYSLPPHLTTCGITIDWPRSGIRAAHRCFGPTTTRAWKQPSNFRSLRRHSVNLALTPVISSMPSPSSLKGSTRTISTGFSLPSPTEGTSSTNSVPFL